MAQFSDVFEGFGPLAVLIPTSLWGVISQGFGVESLSGLRLALAISVVLVWMVGRKLNAKGTWEFGSRAKHRIFRMPMQWFSLVLLAFLIITFTAQPAGGA